MNSLRLVTLWVSGLIACGVTGGAIGDYINPNPYAGGSVFGFLAGISAFTCARLWVNDAREKYR